MINSDFVRELTATIAANTAEVAVRVHKFVKPAKSFLRVTADDGTVIKYPPLTLSDSNGRTVYRLDSKAFPGVGTHKLAVIDEVTNTPALQWYVYVQGAHEVSIKTVADITYTPEKIEDTTNASDLCT